MGSHGDLAAGDFAAWAIAMQGAIRGERGAEVPCDGCTACCTSSQFVHIGPDETDTLSRVPPELVFPAPGLPRGHVVLGYDERGHCPMLVDGCCSIYEHRPRTCRTYDCRIFAASRVDADEALIARRVRRWRFDFPAGGDRSRRAAVEAAAAFLGAHPELLPDGAPATPTGRAVLAVELHDAFLRRDGETGELTLFDPGPQAIRAELERRRAASSEASRSGVSPTPSTGRA